MKVLFAYGHPLNFTDTRIVGFPNVLFTVDYNLWLLLFPLRVSTIKGEMSLFYNLYMSFYFSTHILSNLFVLI